MSSPARILVAVDSANDCRAMVQMAADLAERLEAELDALFIEDIDLINLAALPFSHEITFSADRRPLDSGTMEQQLKIQARQVRDLLTAAAEERKLSWHFRIARGQVLTELFSAAVDANFLALGRSLQSRLRRGGAGEQIAAAHSFATLLLGRSSEVPLEGPVFVVYDGSSGATRALDLAGRLAGPKRSVAVIVVAEDAGAATRLQRRAREYCGSKGIGIDAEMPRYRDVEAVAAQLHDQRQGIVVVPVDGGGFTEEALHALAETLNVPVLIVRGSGDGDQTTAR